jgi:hypothetical protein
MTNRQPTSRLGLLSVLAAGTVLVSMFFLAGGLGSGQNGVALAGSKSNAPAHVVTLTVANCAGPSLQGSLGLSAPFTGQMTLGLFSLGQSSRHLTRQFIDTGLRASANFTGGANGSFTFRSVPGGAPAYEVVVLPSGKITSKTVLIESPAMPPCGTRSVTDTASITQTVTTTATATTTSDVTITVPSNHTVTVTTGTGSVVTLTTTSFTTITSDTTTTSTITSIVTVTSTTAV